MDALGPDLQTIYNLLHDLKRFPLSQSEHQAERSCSEGRGVLCAGKSPASPSPGGCPREGKGARDMLGSCYRSAVPGCCAGRRFGQYLMSLVELFKPFLVPAVPVQVRVQDSSQEHGRWGAAAHSRSLSANPDTVSWRASPNPKLTVGLFAHVSCCR